MKNVTGIFEEYIRFSQIFDEQMIKHKGETATAIREIFRICPELSGRRLRGRRLLRVFVVNLLRKTR